MKSVENQLAYAAEVRSSHHLRLFRKRGRWTDRIAARDS